MDRATGIGWLSVLILLLALTAGAALRGEEVSLRQPLEGLPLFVAGWWGDRAEFSVGDLDLAGSDERVSRIYRHDGREITLLVAYWKRQDPGDHVYTMANAVPSDRWRLAGRARDRIEAGPGGERTVNHVVFQDERTGDRELVHYYYVQAGRMVQGELRGKVLTVVDAVSRRRSDAALVRVASPLAKTVDPAGLERDHHAFLNHLVPLVAERLRP